MAVIETGVRTLLERVEKYGPLTPRQEKILKRSLRNSRKARGMLNGLLEIGRSEAGCFLCCRFQPAKSAYDVLLEALETVTGSEFDQLDRNSDPQAVLTFLNQKGISLESSHSIYAAKIANDNLPFWRTFTTKRPRTSRSATSTSCLPMFRTATSRFRSGRIRNSTSRCSSKRSTCYSCFCPCANASTFRSATPGDGRTCIRERS